MIVSAIKGEASGASLELLRRVCEETEWIAAHRAEFAGRWVVLVGGTLWAAGDSAREVFQAAAGGASTPLVVQIDEDTRPFAGW